MDHIFLCHVDFISVCLILVHYGLIIRGCRLLDIFCPDYITCKELVINEPSPANNDHFHHRDWSTQKKKHKVIKQVYRVKRDGRLNKNSDLILEKKSQPLKH